MAKTKTQFTAAFVKNACALETRISNIPLKEALAEVEHQRKIDTDRFFLWLFQKVSGYPAYTALFNVDLPYPSCITMPSQYVSGLSYLRASSEYRQLTLTLDGKGVVLSGVTFMEMFQDACDKYKKHVEQQFIKDAQELLEKAKTLQLKSPFVQTFVCEPNYEVFPKAKPVLMLERKQFDTESGYVHIQITKAQAEAFKKMQSA